ncbi:MAG: hypothetical protein D6707_11745 [Bacteroidetes bacterium]|nr:MAG: hypothetical protein D6707_11745 [Bacteroidota bacterium]
MNLIPLNNPLFSIIDEFIDSVNSTYYTHCSSELSNFGIHNQKDIAEAVERAVASVKSLNQPVQQHFKKVYIENNGCVVEDWLLSDEGWKLTILNLNPRYRQIAKIQYQIIQKLL